MTATAFDTCAAAKALREAGFDERQAEGVATKTDIARLEDKMATKADKADLADLKADMLKVAIGIVFANAGLTFALLKLLPPAA